MKIMKIKVYAPISGVIKKISDLNDGVFSEKMLGDGFYIEPNSNEETTLFSIFDVGIVVQTFDTKHALFLKAKDGPIVLVHIGLDTVQLDGKPFKLFVQNHDNINLNSEIIQVDWKMIEKAKLNKAIPIVLDERENEGWKFLNIKTGKVKKGEEIAVLEFVQEIKKPTKLSIDEAIKDGFSFKEKYAEISEKIYQAVGTNTNYNKYYNCITRLRFDIKDKTKIQQEELSKIKGVKGINWNGDELQLIFGGEVTKVREAYDQLIAKGVKTQKGFDLKNHGPNTKGMPFFSRLLAMFKGIVLPCLPVFIGIVLIVALKAILEITGAIRVVLPSSNFAKYTLFEVFLFNLTTSSLFITLFISYTATIYFGGNKMYGLIVGMILCGPLLFRGVPNPNGANPWTFVLWSTKSFVDPESPLPVVWLKMGGLNASLINGIFIGYIASKASRFFTKIVPVSLSMIALPPLIVVSTVASMFFVVGPIIGMLETFLGQLVGLLIKIPYGIDRLIFGTLWPMLVITGAHASLAMIIQMPWVLNPGNIYIHVDIMTCIFCSALGQLGMGIGLLIKTKNNQLKQNIYGALPASIFGISEPMMYGVNIPSGKAFFLACCSTGIGSMVIGLTGNGHFWPQGGNGILSILNVLGPNGDTKSLLSCMLGWAVTLGCGMTLALLFCNSRVKEKAGISKIDRKIISILKHDQNVDLSNIKENMKALELIFSKANNKQIIELEKLYEKYEKLRTKIEALEAKENKLKIKLANKFNEQRTMKTKEELQMLFDKINKIDFSNKIEQVQAKKDVIDLRIAETKHLYQKLVHDSQELQKPIIQELIKLSKHNELAKLENNYFNAIHSLDISVKLETKKNDFLTNKQIRAIVKPQQRMEK
ncbi:PTS system, beta-glucoside-specific IIABC component [Williamsoniiplasma lucivorax]|uniref:PTS system, beta-glucoside-specific IIABC component n=2 Tax=Williamsoniiplasma lucivorax TaxID=209274 RepID=A0A2S5RDZ6_9MOLU|nr:PTS system, beta-glucoside-specific IIABC component [Williamsoniiplasma lucivorax]